MQWLLLNFSSWTEWCTEEDRRYSVMGDIGHELYLMALADFLGGMPRGSRYLLRRNCTEPIIISSPGTRSPWATTNG